jgi:hypothetical protein
MEGNVRAKSATSEWEQKQTIPTAPLALTKPARSSLKPLAGSGQTATWDGGRSSSEERGGLKQRGAPPHVH